MSDLNEALLSDDNDDCVEIEEALEEALLQDDPEEEDLITTTLDESETEDPKNLSMDVEEEKSSRPDKFATERKPITAPEPTDDNKQQDKNTVQRSFNRGARGGRFQQQFKQRGGRFQQGRQFNHLNNNRRIQNGSSPRGKTVFVNPNFQGVVKVNNNDARLAWDPHQQQHQPSHPWVNNGAHGNMMQPQIQGYQPQHFQPPMQQIQGLPQMQPMQNMGPPQIHQMQGPPQMQPMQNMGHPQMQYVPQHQSPYGGPQQGPMQPPNLQPQYWNDQMQVPAMPLQSPTHHQGMMPYMQNNYDPQPIIINTATPPPSYQYNNQFNQQMAPMPQQQPEFVPNFQNQNIRQVSVKNQRNHYHDNVGQHDQESFSPKRKGGVGTFSQNKKRVQERLGVKMSPVKSKNVAFKTEDRPSVVKEVTVTEVTTTVKLDDDEATNDLRKKIEDQKRKRQEVIKWKELRRLENLKQAGKEENNEAHSTQAQAIRPVQRLVQGQMRGRGGHQQQNRIQQHQTMANRKPVLHQLTEAVHQSTPMARGARGSRMGRNARGVLGNRVVSIAAPVRTTPTTILRQLEEDASDVKLDKVHMSNFLESRKVLVADKTLLTTRQVFIKNIATSTGDKKIIQICKDIGEVQKLHRDNNERHATITFKSVASAHAFYKKYQRHLLDLSMIEVTLTPESTQD